MLTRTRAVEGTTEAARSLFDEGTATDGFPRPFTCRRFRVAKRVCCKKPGGAKDLFFCHLGKRRHIFGAIFFSQDDKGPASKTKNNTLRSNEATRDSKKIIRIEHTRDKNAALPRSVARWWTWKRACSPERRSRSLKYRAIP